MFLNLSNIETKQLKSSKTGEIYSKTQDIGTFLGFENFKVYYETLEPGRRLSAAHKHSHKKELIVLISGELVVYEGDRKFILRQGQFYFFSPGCQEFHFACNNSTCEAKLLLISESDRHDIISFQ